MSGSLVSLGVMDVECWHWLSLDAFKPDNLALSNGRPPKGQVDVSIDSGAFICRSTIWAFYAHTAQKVAGTPRTPRAQIVFRDLFLRNGTA